MCISPPWHHIWQRTIILLLRVSFNKIDVERELLNINTSFRDQFRSLSPETYEFGHVFEKYGDDNEWQERFERVGLKDNRYQGRVCECFFFQMYNNRDITEYFLDFLGKCRREQWSSAL